MSPNGRRRKMASSADVIPLSPGRRQEPRAIDIEYLPEPFLLFADDGLHVDSKSGIERYGPRSYRTRLHPTSVRIGFIGTAELSEAARSWIENTAVGVRGDATNRSFPGFASDRGFFSSLRFDDGWNATISQSEMGELLDIRRQRERFEHTVDLLEGKLRLIAERDQPPDYIVVVVSDDVLRRCRVADYYDKAEGSVHRDLRRAFKAGAMKYRIPTQLLRQYVIEGRDPTPPAKIAWNFFTGLYHKAGGFPWAPAGLTPGTCYVGISFYRPLGSRNNTLQTSLVQAFDEHGEGLILRGHEFEWDPVKEGSRSPHLTEELSAQLVDLVLDRYEKEMGTRPTRVVVQKTSRYWPGERAGFTNALRRRVARFDLLALDGRQSHVRLITTSKYPPLRGTRFSVGDLDFLYTSGFIAALNEFHGMHVPSPLQIADHIGQDTPRRQLLGELLTLSKLNWNSAGFSGKLPVTVRFADLVGEIMKEIPADREPLPQFKFYI
jgi:hypothetical protein